MNLRKPKSSQGESSPRIWNNDYATILNDLNWLPLSTRRKMRILKVCYVLNDFSCIPASSFTLHPRPSPRHPHNRIIFMPLIKTVTHKSSFFIDVIHLWNILPLSVVSSRSPSSFKSALQNYVYTHSLSLQPHLSNFCDLLTCFLLFSFFGEGLH